MPVKYSLRVKREETIVTDSFEYMQIFCNTLTKCFRIIVIYRPPNGSFANFCLDFSGLLERLSTFGSLLLITDHFAVHSVLPLAKPSRETTRIVYRKLRRIDLASFSSDLQACLAITPAKDLSAFIDHYNTCLLYTSPSPRDLSTSRMPSSA